MKVNSKELIQSYVLTTAKYDFSVYEKRILYRLIELAQADMKGKKLDTSYIIGETLFNSKVIKMPIRAFLKDEKDNNYSRVKKALTDLRNKTIEYETRKGWELIGIIEMPKIEKYGDIVEFVVQPKIWDAILNFAKGYSIYELDTAMQFDSTYTMRFYELFSNNLHPLTFSIDQLKKRFKIEGKYTRVNDFIKYVILSAKKELDKKSPYSFDFEKIKTGRKITAIKFFPYRIPENENPEMEKKRLQLQTSPRWELPVDVLNYLHGKYNFDGKGVRANIELFARANQEFDLLKFSAELYPEASRMKNPRGYLIGAIRNYLEKLEKGKENNQPNKVDELAEQLAKKFKRL